MTYQKAVTDAATGEIIMVDESPEDVADRIARQAAYQAAVDAQAAADQAAAIAAAQDQQTIAANPTDDAINNAKTIADLRELVLKQAAVIRLLISKVGLEA